MVMVMKCDKIVNQKCEIIFLNEYVVYLLFMKNKLPLFDFLLSLLNNAFYVVLFLNYSIVACNKLHR